MAVPPLPEQRRIVAKLEKLLAKAEACQRRLQKIPLILKRFRQSILAAACSGRLTANWHDTAARPEIDDILTRIAERALATARAAAAKAKLKEIHERKEEASGPELPEGWRYVALAKLCESFDYGTSAKSNPIGQVPVLRMGNIQNGTIDWDDLVFTSDREEIEKYRLQPNTVLFNRTNSPELVGKTALYRGERPAIFAGYLIRINNYEELDPRYLNLCLNSPSAKEFCLGCRTDGVSQSNINAQKLGAFEVPFCSLPEQKEIVRRVDELFALADQIEARYKKAKAHVDKLTQSILAKAFRGELVPQDRHDEPASTLLNRIKAETKP